MAVIYMHIYVHVCVYVQCTCVKESARKQPTESPTSKDPIS